MLLRKQRSLSILIVGFFTVAIIAKPRIARTQVYIPVPPPIRHYYGAIAISQLRGVLGFAEDFSTRREAEEVAMEACSRDGVKGCFVVAWFRNTCGALATDSRRIYGFGHSRNAQVAQVNSIEECRKAGGTDCEVREIICTSGRFQ